MCVAYGAGAGGGEVQRVWFITRFCCCLGCESVAILPNFRPRCRRHPPVWLAGTHATCRDADVAAAKNQFTMICLHCSARPFAAGGRAAKDVRGGSAAPALDGRRETRKVRHPSRHGKRQDEPPPRETKRSCDVDWGADGYIVDTYVCVEVVAQDPDATWTPETAASYVLAVPYDTYFYFLSALKSSSCNTRACT